MSLWILLSSAVLAAPPTARVSGAGGARAVAVLFERGETVYGVGCNDAGVAPDVSPDGIHTCGPIPVSTGEARIGVLRDGRLVDLGASTIGGDGVIVRLDGGAAVLAGDASELPAPRAGAPQPAVTTAFVRVRGAPEGQAPVLRLQGPAGSSELVCRDDGVFPDNDRNDGEHGCAGPAPGDGGEVLLNGTGAGSFGKVSWGPGPFAFLQVDVDARTARSESFALPGFAPDTIVVATPPESMETPVPPEPPEPPEGSSPGAEPAPPRPPGEDQPPQPPGADGPEGSPTPRPPQASHSPVASREVGTLPPFALVAALLLGGVGSWAWRRRAHRLPANLRPLPAPALLPGGPSLAERGGVLRTDDPGALAAALLPILARHRRVVVVGDAPLPEVPDGPVYRAARGDWEEIEASVRTLARAPGAPVAVLVIGDALADVGAVAPSPARKLRDGLPAGVWLGIVTPTAPEGVPVWDVPAGPPWSATRVEPSVSSVVPSKG